MTASELATFLRERLPKIAPLVRLGAATGPKDTGLASIEAQELVDALSASVGLLREAENALTEVTAHRPEMEVRHFTISHMPGWTGCKVCQALATLRLVVGEKEDREC